MVCSLTITNRKEFLTEKQRLDKGMTTKQSIFKESLAMTMDPIFQIGKSRHDTCLY